MNKIVRASIPRFTDSIKPHKSFRAEHVSASSLDPFPAIRTKFKIRGDWLATPEAMLRWFVLEIIRLHSPGFVKNSATPTAFQEALSPLNRNERDEE